MTPSYPLLSSFHPPWLPLHTPLRFPLWFIYIFPCTPLHPPLRPFYIFPCDPFILLCDSFIILPCDPVTSSPVTPLHPPCESFIILPCDSFIILPCDHCTYSTLIPLSRCRWLPTEDSRGELFSSSAAVSQHRYAERSSGAKLCSGTVSPAPPGSLFTVTRRPGSCSGRKRANHRTTSHPPTNLQTCTKITSCLQIPCKSY